MTSIKPGAVLGVAGVALFSAMALAAAAQPSGAASIPSYTADGKLNFPADYRDWIYLSSGLDMTYGPAAAPVGQHRFDNVFVDRAAYRAFQATGTWPEQTVMVLEVRQAAEKGSINQAGHFQTDVAATEIHVKDTRRFKSGWGFFAASAKGPANLIPETASCYSCHQASGAVDTTFVQFYPTLLPIAQAKGTLRAGK